MPILSNTIQIEPLYYLISLVFVTASSLVLSFKRLGAWLANYTLVFSIASIEWLLSYEGISISLWIIEVFYLLFFSYVIASFYRSNNANKSKLIFLAATIGSALLLMYQSSAGNSGSISMSFAFNTLLAATVAAFFYRFNRVITGFISLISAIWAVLMVVSLVSSGHWGMAWAVEGLLLLIIGRKYLLPALSNQGQVLAAGAIIYSLAGLMRYFPTPALTSFDGWFLALFVVGAIAAWQRLINNSDAFNKVTRDVIKPSLQFFEALWLTVLTIAALDIWLGHWTGAAAIIGQVALLYRAKYCKLMAIEILAAVLISVPLFYAYQGAELVGNYHFMALPLFAKLAIVSAFLQLWLWSEFYRRFQPESELSKLAESFRILFYLLLPVCWVLSATRRLEFDVLMVLWLSPLLALLLANKIQHRILVFETKILTALTSVVWVVSLGQLSLTNGVVAIAGFFSFFVVAYKLHRSTCAPLHQFICSVGILAFGAALPHFAGHLTGQFFYAVLMASVYWALALNLFKHSDHLKRNEIVISVVNLSLVVVSWGLLSFGIEYLLVAVSFLSAALYKKQTRFIDTLLGRIFKDNTDLLLHSIFAMTYVCAFLTLSEYRIELLIAPALAVHGAAILFLKDKRLITVKFSFALIAIGVLKLAFIDAANVLLWQKVMLFMGIGVFILLASFWYQKLVSKSAPNYSNGIDNVNV